MKRLAGAWSETAYGFTFSYSVAPDGSAVVETMNLGTSIARVMTYADEAGNLVATPQ